RPRGTGRRRLRERRQQRRDGRRRAAATGNRGRNISKRSTALADAGCRASAGDERHWPQGCPLRLRELPLLMADPEKANSAGVRRREFLKVLGAGSAAAATVGCTSEKVGKLIPYLVSPDETVPGVSTYYATTCRECPAACGVIAETRDGRAIKLEGNPEHPLNRGALCARGQSALQGLYNPDRFRAPMIKTGGAWRPATWDEAITLLSQKLGEARGRGTAGTAGTAVFFNQHESGSFPAFLDGWLASYGIRPHLSVDFEADHAAIEAHRRAYGVSWPRWNFGDAKLIISFGADFLDGWGAAVADRVGLGDAPAKVAEQRRVR